MRGTNPQYNTDNYTALITKRQLVVVGLSSVSTNLISVVGGTSATGTVQLSESAHHRSGLGNGTDVLLSSNNPAAKPTASVHFNEGDVATAIFTITTTPVSQDTTAIITANLNGVIRTLSFLIKRTGRVRSTEFAGSSDGRIGRQQCHGHSQLDGSAPANGITVNLSSSNAKAVVPATVKVNAGSDFGDFHGNDIRCDRTGNSHDQGHLCRHQQGSSPDD